MMFEQHSRGIYAIEGFVGNSLSTLQSIGMSYSPSGNVTTIPEQTIEYFSKFPIQRFGTYLQIILRWTHQPGVYALYRMIPQGTLGKIEHLLTIYH